jgi:hypothetical protein
MESYRLGSGAAVSCSVVLVAVVPVAASGGVLSLSAVVEAWLSFAAWMMTVLVEVEVRPDWW